MHPSGSWRCANWLGPGTFDVRELIDQDNTEDLAYVLRWRPGSAYAKDAPGLTPLNRARGEETAALLRKHGAKTGDELDTEAKQNKAEKGKKE